MQSDYIRISKLISQLEEMYPNKLPSNPQISLEDVRKLQGQQEVVEYIKTLLEDNE